MTRVLLVDDQALIRAGFRAIINAADDLQVVGEAADGREALAVLKTVRADVAVIDIGMPVMDGLATTRAISADPALDGVKVLILTTFELDEHVFDALAAGASGFLGKGVEPAELLTAIRTVAAGEAQLSPRATQALIRHYVNSPGRSRPPTDSLALLTEREHEIALLVADGLTNDEIAARLVLSPFTVKSHVNRAMTKVGARDRAQLVVSVLTGRPGPTHHQGGASRR